MAMGTQRNEKMGSVVLSCSHENVLAGTQQRGAAAATTSARSAKPVVSAPGQARRELDEAVGPTWREDMEDVGISPPPRSA
jgi:hypothetical protein